ncbi:MAG: DUF4340 domain-containing protein [Clostridia bacterium]|nr:DUF4340 domain-containing protein [Clostridia bacterium]
MNKRIKKLILLVFVAILLIVACVFVASLNKSEEDTPTVDETIIVATIDVDSVVSLEYTYGGTLLGFTCNGGQWSFDSDPEFPLTQNIITTMISDSSVVKATRMLHDAEDASVYGFDNPSLTVKFKTADAEFSFEIGDSNSYNGGYYLRYNGDIYVTDELLVSTFSKDLYDYLTTTDIPDLENIVSFTVDLNEITDSDSVEELSEAFAAIARGEVADYRSKESYGFDGTEHKVVVKYQTETNVTDTNGNAISNVTGEYSYNFAFSVIDGNYYVMLADDELIYKADGLSAFIITE